MHPVTVLSHIILEQGCFLNATFIFIVIDKYEMISCCGSLGAIDRGSW